MSMHKGKKGACLSLVSHAVLYSTFVLGEVEEGQKKFLTKLRKPFYPQDYTGQRCRSLKLHSSRLRVYMPPGQLISFTSQELCTGLDRRSLIPWGSSAALPCYLSPGQLLDGAPSDTIPLQPSPVPVRDALGWSPAWRHAPNSGLELLMP